MTDRVSPLQIVTRGSTKQPLPHQQEHRPGGTALIAAVAGQARDGLAHKLLAMGVTPNMLTVTGLVLTGGTAVCMLMGAGYAPPWETRWAVRPTSWWPLVGAILFSAACVCDLLDGTVARVGNLNTRFGALLDSATDRFSDMFMFLGCAMHFSLAGNVTYVTLSMTAMAGAMLISYVKARAETLTDHCHVGYWQRGERCGLFLAAAYAGHIPAALWVLGTLPLLTVFRRLGYARDTIEERRGWQPRGWMRHVTPWRHPRGSVGYDVCMGSTLAFVFLAPPLWPALYGYSDPLRELLS